MRAIPGGSAVVLTASGSIAGTSGMGFQIAAFGLAASAASAIATIWDSSSPTANLRWTLVACPFTTSMIPFPRPIICGSGISISISGTAACAMVNYW